MAKLGPARKYPVVVTIGDFSFRNTVSWYKGAFAIAFSAENRAASALAAGDEVEVTLEIDDQPRVLELADEFQLALGDRLDDFRALSYSKQRGFYEPWEKAKSQETRDKNLAKIIAALSLAQRALAQEAARQSRRTLQMLGHRDGRALGLAREDRDHHRLCCSFECAMLRASSGMPSSNAFTRDRLSAMSDTSEGTPTSSAIVRWRRESRRR